MLVLDEVRAHLPARESHREVVAEPEDEVVPPRRERHERAISEIGVLRLEEPAHERLVDVDFGLGHVAGRHAGRR